MVIGQTHSLKASLRDIFSTFRTGFEWWSSFFDRFVACGERALQIHKREISRFDVIIYFLQRLVYRLKEEIEIDELA